MLEQVDLVEANDLVDLESSRVARVYQEIKQRIIFGRYRPGTHVSEATLARVCRASRTPVREALARLSGDGYVVSVPGRGFVIAPITISMVRNVFQLRRILETAAAQAAADVATPEDVEEMWQLADYSKEGTNGDDYRIAFRRNVDFHLAIAKATRNDLLVDAVRHCLIQVYRVFSLGGDLTRFEAGAGDEHRALVDAIAHRDPTAAREAVERHLDRGAGLIMENVVDGRIKGLTV